MDSVFNSRVQSLGTRIKIIGLIIKLKSLPLLSEETKGQHNYKSWQEM